MSGFVKLTQAVVRQGVMEKSEPVWVNPFGVNSVEGSGDERGTYVRMDDGSGFCVAESVRTVIGRLNKAMQTRDEVL